MTVILKIPSETTSAWFREKSERNVAWWAQFQGNDCRSVNGGDVGSSCARLVTELCQTGHCQLDNYLPHIGTVCCHVYVMQRVVDAESQHVVHVLPLLWITLSLLLPPPLWVPVSFEIQHIAFPCPSTFPPPISFFVLVLLSQRENKKDCLTYRKDTIWLNLFWRPCQFSFLLLIFKEIYRRFIIRLLLHLLAVIASDVTLN